VSEVLIARSASYVDSDGALVTVDQGEEIPAGAPSEWVDGLRSQGALSGSGASDAVGLGPTASPALDSQALNPHADSTTPDPASTSTEDLAKYIEDNGLNAADTVALAQGDPSNAQAVIDAEELSHGGDGRNTVVEPLTALRDG
jgi:hypothetical protein